MAKGFSFTTEWRTTEIRPFEQDCWDAQTLAEIIDGFQQAFRVELEEIAAYKVWAQQQFMPEQAMEEGMREYGGIITKSNFLNNRRKAIEAEIARRRGDAPTLLTQPLPEDRDERILAEPEYVALLNDDLSDPSRYFGKKAKHAALQNRKKLDRAIQTVRQAEDLSRSLNRSR